MISNIDCGATRNPRVLVSGSMDSKLVSPELNATLRTLTKSVTDQLAAAGLDADVVDAATSCEAAEDLTSLYDGLVILGGGDIHPEMYGQEAASCLSYGIDVKADTFEIALVRSAVSAGLPLVGICRGMQILNVALGGTLIQDLGPETMHNSTSDNAFMTGHSVRVLRNTRLGEIFGECDMAIRSGHHQAVDQLGNGLIISAFAADGVVEAIELDGHAWGVGVQWHPEESLADTTQIGKLFEAFARHCAVFAERRALTSLS